MLFRIVCTDQRNYKTQEFFTDNQHIPADDVIAFLKETILSPNCHDNVVVISKIPVIDEKNMTKHIKISKSLADNPYNQRIEKGYFDRWDSMFQDYQDFILEQQL